MRKLMHTMDEVPGTRKMAKQSTKGRNKMNPYKPRFMYQSTSLDVGDGPKKDFK